MIKGKISSFETMGLVDGPGVRFVVFMQGCALRCAYCHNPETWKLNNAKLELTPEELVNKVLRYKPYFKTNGGITLSGGEPLLQAKFVSEVFKLCKQNGIHTCLDTSGYATNYNNALDYCDLVILDVKELNKDKYTELTGGNIDKFYAFVNEVQQKNIPMWLRQVIVPDYNDNEKSVLELKEFAKNLKNIEKIELLPFHNMAENKYNNLNLEYKLKGKKAMSKTKVKQLQKLLDE